RRVALDAVEPDVAAVRGDLGVDLVVDEFLERLLLGVVEVPLRVRVLELEPARWPLDVVDGRALEVAAALGVGDEDEAVDLLPHVAALDLVLLDEVEVVIEAIRRDLPRDHADDVPEIALV